MRGGEKDVACTHGIEFIQHTANDKKKKKNDKRK